MLHRLAHLDLRNPSTHAEALSGIAAEMFGAARVYLHSTAGQAPTFDTSRLGAATLAALADSCATITRTSAPDLLPFGAALIAPVVSTPGGVLHGAILIEHIADGERALERSAARAAILGRALGALLDAAVELRQPNVKIQTERRLAVAD